MRGFRRLVLPVSLALSLVLSLLLPLPRAVATTLAASSPFSDVTGHWAAGVITQAAGLSLVGGYPDGTFRPDGPVTRAEFVKMAVQARGLPLQPDLPAPAVVPPHRYGFSDTTGHWVDTQGYLRAALNAGLIVFSDYGPVTPLAQPAFDPDRPITRIEVAEIATRALREQSAAMVLRRAPLPFNDAVPDWASGAVAVMTSTGVMSGYPDGSFGPGRTLSRAEAASIAVHLLTVAAAEGIVTPPAALPPQQTRTVPVWEANSWQVQQVPAPTRPDGSISGQTYLAGASDGTLYLAEGDRIWQFPAGGEATSFYQGSTGPLAAGPDGSLYMAVGYQILRVDAGGKAVPWAGSGQDAYADGPGTAAGFRQIAGLCADSQGNLYATEYGGLLRKIDPHGNVTTLAGVTPLQAGAIYPPGSSVPQASEGPGYLATLGTNPGPCAVDAQGNVYVADLPGGGIRRVAPDGTVSWLAGHRWYPGYADGLAAEAQFRNITALAADAYGDLWIADAGNQRIRRVTPDGHVYTVVGSSLVPVLNRDGAVIGYRGADVDGRGPLAQLNDPAGLAVVNGRLYVAQSSGSPLRVITGDAAVYPAGWAVVPVAGAGLVPASGIPVKVATGPVTVALALYAPVGVVDLSVDGQLVAQGGNPAYTMGWDATHAAVGTHQVRLDAQQLNGSWVHEGGFTPQVDPSYKPVLYPVHYALVTPGSGSWVSGQVPIIVTGDGITESISIDGKTLATSSSRLITATWDSTSVPDGVHTLGLSHYVPEQGKTYTDSFTIHVINHSVPRREDDQGPGLRVYLNGQLHIYTTVPPRLVDGVPYLPFTETLQQLGFQVTWDSASRTLTAQKGDRVLTLNIDTGAVTATPPQHSYTLGQKPILVQALTLVPWTLFTDATGTNSRWAPDESTVRIGL